MNAIVLPFHADFIAPAPLRRALPFKPAKAEDLALKYGEDCRAEGHQAAVDARSRNYAYDDMGREPADFEPLRDEIERLEAAEFDRDNILETTTLLLLTLSLLEKEIAKQGPTAVAAVEAFRKAVMEATNA